MTLYKCPREHCGGTVLDTEGVSATEGRHRTLECLSCNRSFLIEWKPEPKPDTGRKPEPSHGGRMI